MCEIQSNTNILNCYFMLLYKQHAFINRNYVLIKYFVLNIAFIIRYDRISFYSSNELSCVTCAKY